jgi:hypothetical protein
VAHEIVHSINKSGEKGVVLKLDYEKAYDRVSWNFLFDMLVSRNFDAKPISWIRQIVMGLLLVLCSTVRIVPFLRLGKVSGKEILFSLSFLI